MAFYKVGTRINFKKQARKEWLQLVALALLNGIILGLAITQ